MHSDPAGVADDDRSDLEKLGPDGPTLFVDPITPFESKTTQAVH